MTNIYVFTESEQTIVRKILRALRLEINEKLQLAIGGISTRIKSLTYDFLINTPEYAALINGPLTGQFGFYKGTQEHQIRAIIDELIEQVYIEHTLSTRVTAKGNFSGGIKISIIDADFKRVMQMNEAHILTEKGETLPWLEWLIVKGDKIIIDTHYFRPGGFKRSRSGKGLMYENTETKRYWRVPPEYKGTIRNNWFTRAIFGHADVFLTYVSYIIEEEIKRVLDYV